MLCLNNTQFLSKKFWYMYNSFDKNGYDLSNISCIFCICFFFPKAPRVLQTSQRENIQSVAQTIVRPSKHNVNLQSRTGYPEIPHNDTGKHRPGKFQGPGLQHRNIILTFFCININLDNIVSLYCFRVQYLSFKWTSAKDC